MRFRAWVLVVAIGLCASSLFAADWPQFRGPSRDGVAPLSVPLVDAIGAEGLKPLWSNEEIRGGDAAGWGSPVVALGRVFVYQNYNLPAVHRTLYKGAYDSLGYVPDMPADLSKAVEEARASDARKELDNRAVDPWVKDWLDTHVTAEQKAWRGAAQARLKAGAKALPLDVCAKLAAIVNRRFESVAELDAWAKENGLDEDAMTKLRALAVPGEEKTPKDTVYCLDAATGREIWKTALTGNWFYYPCSYTPAVAAGRVYTMSSDARVFCLDFGAGVVLWKSEQLGPDGFHHNRSSSPLVLDGVVIVFSETCLAGLDAITGKTLWKNPALRNQQSSAATWTSGGKTYALVNAGNLCLVDPKDGKVVWSVKCGGVSTPAVSGDLAVVAAGDPLGLTAYKMTPEKAEVMWSVPWKDAHSAALIRDGFAYALGGAYYDRNQAKAICVELATGKTKWEQTVGQAQHSSPLLSDGKIVAINGSALLLIAATPEKYNALGTANVGADMWASPALADGKLFVRTGKGVACYSLAK